jgi:streptogramin lyase
VALNRLALTWALGVAALTACTSTGAAPNPPTGTAIAQLVVGMRLTSTSGTLSAYASPYTGAPKVSGIATGEPWNMTSDSHGNLWVATGYAKYAGSYSVLEYTKPLTASSTPAVTIPVSTGGASEGVAFDSAGDLFVSSYTAHMVTEFKPPLTSSSTAAATITNGLSGPEGVAFDPNGNLWVCDASASDILEYAPPFTAAPVLTLGVGTLVDPQTAEFDAKGDLFIADDGSRSVYEYTPPFSGASSPAVTLSLSDPQALAIDPSGNLWVSDRGTNAVYEYKPPFSSGMAASLTVTNGVSSPWGLTFLK